MNNSLKNWFLADVIFVLITGTLLHFIYDWSGGNKLAGIVGTVNESTWEHLKLLFWPSLIFAIIEYLFIGKDYENYAIAKAVTFYTGILLIVVLFYTYMGVTGKHSLVIDLLIFLISVVVSQWIGYRILQSEKTFGKEFNLIAILSILLLIFAFTVFTFQPPRLPLFKDPVTGTYGILAEL